MRIAKPSIENARFWNLTDAELNYIIKDAGEACQLASGFDSAAERKYADQVNDACTVLHYRKRLATKAGNQSHAQGMKDDLTNYREYQKDLPGWARGPL